MITITPRNTLTKRQEHAANLSYIREVGGDDYYRKMSFQEADSWLNAYNYYLDEGHGQTNAVQRAWDHHFSSTSLSVQSALSNTVRDK